MNIEKLIQQIKLRPGMYVGNLNLESIFCFINGFLFNNIITDRADEIDIMFKNEFHHWVKTWLEKNEKIFFEEERDCVFYISETYQDLEKCLNKFFDLSLKFFHEIHESTSYSLDTICPHSEDR